MRGNSEDRRKEEHNRGEKDYKEQKYNPPGGSGVLSGGAPNRNKNQDAYRQGYSHARKQDRR